MTSSDLKFGLLNSLPMFSGASNENTKEWQIDMEDHLKMVSQHGIKNVSEMMFLIGKPLNGNAKKWFCSLD